VLVVAGLTVGGVLMVSFINCCCSSKWLLSTDLGNEGSFN